jgi:hypothetical protein
MKDLADSIPLFFYDLISRIIPGALLVGLLIVLQLPGGAQLEGLDLLSPTGLLPGLGLCYLIGLLLTPLGYLWGCLVWLLLSGSGFLTILLPGDLWKQIDAIAKDEPKGSEALSKMAAEMTLAENSLIAVIIVVLAARYDYRDLPLLLWLVVAFALCAIFRKAALGGRAAGLPKFPEIPRRSFEWRRQSVKGR